MLLQAPLKYFFHTSTRCECVHTYSVRRICTSSAQAFLNIW